MATQDVLNKYKHLIKKALEDGNFTSLEQQKLAGIRAKYKITNAKHNEILKQVKQEMMKRSSRGGPVTTQGRSSHPISKRPAQKSVPVIKGPPKKTGTGGKAKKAATGARKLDGILEGGLPLKSTSLINGPPFIGKEVFMYQFILKGLEMGQPVVIVTTEKTASDVKNKIVGVSRDFVTYDKKGLVRMIDCYSNTVGMTGNAPNTLYINGVKNANEILTTVQKLQKHIKEKYYGHRIVILSLTTFIRDLGINNTLQFLNAFTSRTKLFNGIALIDIASGMAPENEITAIVNTLDGGFEFRTDGQNKQLRIIGLGNVENRDWIGFEAEQHSFDIKAAQGYNYIT